MLMYAIGIQPLVSRLKDPDHHKQNRYADDSSCGGHLGNIKTWFFSLMKLGPAFGNFAEPSMSPLVVKSEHLEEAMTLFSELKVEIVTSSRFMGGCIGAEDGVRDFLKKKVSSWVECVKRLSKTAKAYSQAAYSAFTRSLACEWT